jgi:hypothetical protein
VEIGESQSEAGLGKSIKPYLKKKLKAQGLEAWLKWQSICPASAGPDINSQYYQKKQKQKQKQKKPSLLIIGNKHGLFSLKQQLPFTIFKKCLLETCLYNSGLPIECSFK